ncbi:MAG: hypothetical protein ACE5H0_09775 [Bacteroidota bacterium]
MPIDTRHVKAYIVGHVEGLSSIILIAERMKISSETMREELVRKEKPPFFEFIRHTTFENPKRLLVETDLRC